MSLFRQKTVGLIVIVGLTILVAGLLLWCLLGPPGADKNDPQEDDDVALSVPWNKLTAIPSLDDLTAKVATPEIGDKSVRVPFTLLTTDEKWKGEVYFNPTEHRSHYVRQDGVTVEFPFPGVPINIQPTSNGGAAIAFRGIFDNRLWLLSFDEGGRLLSAHTIRRDGINYPIFRAATVGDGFLYWVIYDNKTRKNYLRSFKSGLGGWEQLAQDLELPSFEPPAGSTYEMEPMVFLHADSLQSVEIIGGNWYGRATPQKILESARLVDCETALEAEFGKDVPLVLCRTSGKLAEEGAAYAIASPREKNASPLDASQGVPWRLHIDKNELPAVDYARTPQDLREVFVRDISKNHFGGMLEFGSNNVEGRVPWSQIYYLNGWMDAILLSKENQDAFDLYGDILTDLRLRLELEIRLLDDLMSSDYGMLTQAFTFDRSAALFAVQTSRILLLLERYTDLFPDVPPIKSLAKLRIQVPSLEGHIEILAHDGEDSAWMTPGTAHLRWPKGSAFYFDGMSVPFNHQNEWASSIFEMQKAGVPIDATSLAAAHSVIDYFLQRLGKDGGFPSVDEWYYWYGHAYDGWKASEDRSVHMPEYVGDHGLAWISFRTIDLMSVMSAIYSLPEASQVLLKKTASDRIRRGEVYPFAARSIIEHEQTPSFKLAALYPYFRAEAPWALSNNVWALPLLAGFYKNNSPTK